MMREGIDKHWIRSIDGKFTFCGALEDCYPQCSKNWKSTATRTQYDRDYNEKILPALPTHDDRTIDSYTYEDYLDAIQAIADRGQGKPGDTFRAYSPATLQHFRHLIKTVVSAAAEKGVCDDVFWGSCFDETDTTPTEQDIINERVLLKKSLTPSEETHIARLLFRTPAQRGQDTGLLLMFALGLRNGEACGANYGDIKPMLLSPESKVLWVYKSTKSGSSQLQSSGKTRNSDRILPIPQKLVSFLEQRRAFLVEELKKSGLPFDDAFVDQLPISCVGFDFTRRCSAAQLTSAGRELFRRAGLREQQLTYIDAELQRAVNEKQFEKDPSAYLFRRNFGTHLFILGLSEAEIQYVVGHDIEDLYETRNEFVNEERLLEIKQKMEQRPIFNSIRATPTIITASTPHTVSMNSHNEYHFEASGKTILIHLEAEEPSDSIQPLIEVSPAASSCPHQEYRSALPAHPQRHVNILKKYHELYRKV